MLQQKPIWNDKAFSKDVREPDVCQGRGLFKSGFEIPVHGDRKVVAESGAWCNDLEGRCQKGELR